MNKRMIDADALLSALVNKKPKAIHNPPVAIGYEQAICDLQMLISELPTPQESIFDADGWCWDMEKAPKDGSVFLGIIEVASTNFSTEGMPEQSVSMIAWDCIKEDFVDIVCEKTIIKVIAWRPLPPIPSREGK